MYCDVYSGDRVNKDKTKPNNFTIRINPPRQLRKIELQKYYGLDKGPYFVSLSNLHRGINYKSFDFLLDGDKTVLQVKDLGETRTVEKIDITVRDKKKVLVNIEEEWGMLLRFYEESPDDDRCY